MPGKPSPTGQASDMRQRGLSLVELLVAMALGLLLLAGVIQVVLGSKRSYQSSVALAELQETGRFALEAIARDLRNAGFSGACASGLVNTAGAEGAKYAIDASAIEGFGAGMSAPAWMPSERLANTDAVLLRYASEPVLEARSISGNRLFLASSGAVSGAFYLLSDQQSCLLLRNAGNAASLLADRSLEHFLAAATRVYRYRYVIYSIRRNDDGTPGLFVTDNSQTSSKSNTEELVNGVAGMSLRYGVAGVGSEVVAAYKAAREMTASDWRRVRTVRISLLLQSQTREVDEAPKALQFDGRTLPPNAERRLRLVMSSTIALRNPSP
ncbi:prepilin-type N-terminal cleavage/methylation domain-containing protein [Pseudomonas denitrificans (nom. rej.)]|uniref:Prepilin-type N-terminal cleavage/methylation domain-containing protein n=2 Tax=Pseudomonas denitrificans TaxID=43306 RepID=A0A9X7R5W0_PSEDE|nr:prepilin-type N-terminal cleavage/methylation domain-containing protein [Pseudomonas denitrificans (nom. rej.)]